MNRKIIAIAVAIALPVVAHAAPNDQYYASKQWYMQNQAAGAINAAAGWERGLSGKGVTIGVVDTGYTTHEDFGANIIAGYDFVNYDNNDNLLAFTDGDDQPGRDADARDPGDYVSASYLERMAQTASGYNAAQLSTCQDVSVSDSTWHGTKVSGILAAKRDNGTGIAGIVPNAKVVVSRALGKCGGYLRDIMDAARWSAGLEVAGVPTNQNPAKIINLSLGGKGACSKNEQDAIDAIVAHGAIVVVSAGNQAGDVNDYAPANCNNTITVSAVSYNGGRTKYSNYGSNVTISAPGGSGNFAIATTSHKTASKVGPIYDDSSSVYANARGTSYAAPLVSGVIAMMLEANPEMTQPEVALALRATAKPFPRNVAVGGADESVGDCDNMNCGAGIIDAAAAINAAYQAAANNAADALVVSEVSSNDQVAEVAEVAEVAAQSEVAASGSAGGAFSVYALIAMLLVMVRRAK